MTSEPAPPSARTALTAPDVESSALAPSALSHSAPEPTAALTVSHLMRTYGARRAVDDISFTVPSGSVYGLLGPNGAGKTTTLEMCAGLRRRDGGSIDLLGMDPQRLSERDRNRLGIVAQSGSERASLTVREMLAQYAAYCEDPWDIDELLAATGLGEKARARIGTLSGGQRRRLDVALGIVARPELVFLDEPTTGFDPAARRGFWELIRTLRRDGTTIVLTSHYLDEIEALADRLAVIRSGKIVAEGTLEQIRHDHAASAVVTWTGPEGPQERTTPDPEPLLRELLTAREHLPDLEVRRPSLEDIYLDLVSEESR